MKEKIERMQKNLCTLRKSLGWTAAELGEKLDVTRQMISNLETYKCKMNTMQYLAIYKVVDDVIKDRIRFTDDIRSFYMTRILLVCFIRDSYFDWFSDDEEMTFVRDLINVYAEAAFAKVKPLDEVHTNFIKAMEMKGLGCFFEDNWD